MRLRLVVPPLLVLGAGGALLLLQPRPAPSGRGAPAAATGGGGSERPAPARAGPPPGGFRPWPVHPEILPRTESVPARVRCPEPVVLSCPLRSPFLEIPARAGAVVRKGDLLARVSLAPFERQVEAAKTDGERRKALERLQEALEQAEIRAPADGIVFQVDARLGELPPRGRDGPRPCVVLFDWKALVFEGTATGATADLVRGGAPLLVRLPGDLAVPAEAARAAEPGPDGSLRIAARPIAAPGVALEPGGEGLILVHAGSREGFSVPAAAVLVEDRRRVVYVVPVQGDLERRPVVTGERLGGGRIEVSGVRAGESVAVWENRGQ